MKKYRLVLSILLLFSITTGCSSAPSWLNETPPKDVLWGIGSARQFSDSMSMTIAETRARKSIARQLDAMVQAVFAEYGLADTGTHIINMDISGVRPIQRWKAKDGKWWCLAEMKKSDARDRIAAIFEDQETASAGFNAQQALRMLDVLLAKNEKPLVVNR